MSEKYEIIIANGLETRVWTHHPTYGYGCAECCNGDRCDEDCDAKYRRKDCPHCKGSGWIKKDDASTPPTTEEAELWKEIIKYLDQDIDYFLCIPELMQKYQLRRRSEQTSEAIEFGEWLNEYSQDRTLKDRHVYKDHEKVVMTIPEAYQEFQLFKQKQ